VTKARPPLNAADGRGVRRAGLGACAWTRPSSAHGTAGRSGWSPASASTADPRPSSSGRAALRRSPQSGHLASVGSARRPASAIGGQRGLATGTPALPSLIRGLGTHPQSVSGLQPHALTRGLPGSGQAITIGIPHTSRRRSAISRLTAAWRQRSDLPVTHWYRAVALRP
jgi:hypothetical protein